jgi:hypothetical protein
MNYRIWLGGNYFLIFADMLHANAINILFDFGRSVMRVELEDLGKGKGYVRHSAFGNLVQHRTACAVITEDWLSLWIGLGIFALALYGLEDVDLLGWVVWTDPTPALGDVSKGYASLGGWPSCII